MKQTLNHSDIISSTPQSCMPPMCTQLSECRAALLLLQRRCLSIALAADGGAGTLEKLGLEAVASSPSLQLLHLLRLLSRQSAGLSLLSQHIPRWESAANVELPQEAET